MAQLLRVQNFTVSEDGFGSGEGQSLERPFGHANPAELMAWAFPTAHWPNRSEPGGSRGVDDYFMRDFDRNIGAEIMGRNKFGPMRGPWENLDWQGWWGDSPPFHTPVFVLTHHARPSFTLDDTIFHFVEASPADVLETAKAAAGGLDVRLGGGVATIREFWTQTWSTRCTSWLRRSSSGRASVFGYRPTSSPIGFITRRCPVRVA